MSTLERAIAIAAQAHAGQIDKAGAPYVLHPLRVMLGVYSTNERITAVLQGVHDNYDTDLFKHLITASAEASGSPINGPHAVSHRVIADHLRASCFLIADGVLPSNEGRGYVLRRIMRRAMRHAHILGAKDPLMHRLVPTLVAEMGEA